jgi:hypothetical protein
LTINHIGLTPTGALYTNKTNYTTSVTVPVNGEALMTITSTGIGASTSNTNFISCNAYV